MRLVGLLVLLSACEGGLDGAGPGGGDRRMPSVEFTSPLDGDGRYGTSIPASFTVENFTLDQGGGNSDEVGHVHAYLDDVPVGETDLDSFTFADVSSGDHVLGLKLARNDETEIGQMAEIGIHTLAPTLAVTSPVDGTESTASNVPFLLSVADFTISADTAFGDNQFGQGRYRVLVDDNVVDLGVDPNTIEVSPLGEGSHVVRVELATADGEPIDPPVADEVNVGVLTGAPEIAVDRDAYLGTLASATAPLQVSAVNAPLDYHVYLDGVFAMHSVDPEVALRHLAPGYHYVELRLTNGGSELPVHDHLHLYVAGDRPDVTITSPGDQWGVASEFDLSANPENVELDSNIGGANVPGHGHLAVMLDGADVAESATGSAHLSGLTPGPHQIRVELRNNDRTPMDPPVYDVINVSVN